MAEKLDCVIIGAGAVGLAIARSLAISGRAVVVLEAESVIGTHSSSRNSEVIHAGLYYPEDSLKARLCVAGSKLLYAFCDERHVPVERIGKLVVACRQEETHRLAAIAEQARKNGVLDLRFVELSEVRAMEPAVECVAALLSPSTGIFDSHSYMLALHADIEAYGGMVVCDSEVADVRIHNDGFYLAINGADDEEFVCNTVVNSAGLRAVDIARTICKYRDLPQQRLAIGHYFSYQGKSPFAHLIYPIPSSGGLGVHATNDFGGAARFGPDISWVNSLDYSFDESRKPDFVAAIRKYFPTIDEYKLVPAYTGIRPKVSGPGEPPADFMIHGEDTHGVRGLVNLFGIESPGLTASLAIAEHVRELLG